MYVKTSGKRRALVTVIIIRMSEPFTEEQQNDSSGTKLCSCPEDASNIITLLCYCLMRIDSSVHVMLFLNSTL